MKPGLFSIRARLVWWFGSLLACILAGFAFTAYELARQNALQGIDEGLARRVRLLQEDWRHSVPPMGPPAFGKGPPPDRGPPPDGGPPGRGRPGDRPPFDDDRGGPPGGKLALRLSAGAEALFADSSPEAFYYAAWRKGTELFARSSNAPSDLPVPAEGASEQDREVTRDHRRERYHYTEAGDCVLVGISLVETERAARRMAWWLSGAGFAVLLVGAGGAWIIATGALRPVKSIGAAASRIAAGNLAERIDIADTRSELGELAGVLNGTFARLEAAFAEQKNFTADASHELRTPLAALITTMQVQLARDRPAEEYREAMEACLRTAQQMRRLAESLLALARFDAGQEPLQKTSTDLSAIVRQEAEVLTPLAEQKGISLECALAAAPVCGDADRLGQVVMNLVSNAILYNRDRGWVKVTTRVEKGLAVVEVADGGMGISPEDLPQIFKRFFRADQARTHMGGNSGLGLAICRAIVEAHGGTIEVKSAMGEGTTFTVRIPAGAVL